MEKFEEKKIKSGIHSAPTWHSNGKTIFYSKIASDDNIFDIGDVTHLLCEKLINRHPHIYGDIKEASETVVNNKLDIASSYLGEPVVNDDWNASDYRNKRYLNNQNLQCHQILF